MSVMKSFRHMLPGRVASRRSPDDMARDTNAWIRWAGVWDALFYVLLVVALTLSLVDMGPSGGPQLLIGGLSVLFGLWYWFMIIRHRRWIHKDFPMLIYAAGAVALCVTLIWINPTYNLLLFVMYSQLYSFLRIRWAIPASVVLTVFLVLRGILDAPEAWPYWVFIATLSVFFGIFFALWINSIIEQSQKRQQLIKELESTREELAARQRRAGILEERSRLAREIHDTLAQGFISIVTHLEAAEGALSPGSDQARRHLQQARRTARENLVEARHLVAALRPEILEGISLSGALGRLAQRWSEETGILAAVPPSCAPPRRHSPTPAGTRGRARHRSPSLTWTTWWPWTSRMMEPDSRPRTLPSRRTGVSGCGLCASVWRPWAAHSSWRASRGLVARWSLSCLWKKQRPQGNSREHPGQTTDCRRPSHSARRLRRHARRETRPGGCR